MSNKIKKAVADSSSEVKTSQFPRQVYYEGD